MRVIVAKTAGFCWGVRRAMDAVLDASANKQSYVQTLGPLIHNPQALKLIEKRGVSIADSLDAIKNGTVVIRAHGIPIQNLMQLKEHQRLGKISIVNATCPEVAKVQSRIKKWSPKGYFTIILGTHNHAESVAHQSFAKHGSVIVTNLEEAQALPDTLLTKVLVVAQTTFINKNFQAIAEHIRNRSQDCIIENTICKDTWIRQNEAKDIAQTVDYVIVVGGKTSSNTKHLAELAINLGKPVQHVETAAEIDFAQFKPDDNIGVIAGASTPTWLVDEVANALRQHNSTNGVGNVLSEHLIESIKLTLGIGFLALGAYHWIGLPITWHYLTIAMGYALAISLLAPYLDPLDLESRGPAYTGILRLGYRFTILTAVLVLVATLAIAYHLGLTPMMVIGASFVLGLTYNKIIKWGHTVLRLKIIPGCNDIMFTIMLAIVVIALPLWHMKQAWSPRSWSGIILVISLLFARTTIQHLRNMQNDQILGKATLPIVYGRRTAKIAFIIGLAIAFVSNITINFLQPTTKPWLSAIILIACIGYAPIYLWFLQEHVFIKKYKIEPLSEISFMILSLLNLI